MRFVLTDIRRDLDKRIREMSEPIAIAATAAVREAGEIAVAEGRRQIAAQGFGRRWQTGFVSTAYPKRRASLRPMVVVRHKNPIMGLFEEGGTITGDPYLFLPLPSAPRIGRRAMRPREYTARGGELRSVNRPGRPPLLVGKTRFGSGPDIPLYVGVRSVRIRKRFTLYNVIARAAARLPELFRKHFMLIRRDQG